MEVPPRLKGGQDTQWDCVRSDAMPPKQKTKAELKQAVDQLTEKLRAADARLDADVEHVRDRCIEVSPGKLVEDKTSEKSVGLVNGVEKVNTKECKS